MHHTDSSFTGGHNTRIVYDKWSPDTTPTALAILVHGLGEHARRYDHVTSRLVDEGYIVYAADHRGHGRSGGKRMHLRSLTELTADLDLLIDIAQTEHPDLPTVLLGHSMGGATALTYALDHQNRLTALVLSGPAVVVTTGTPKIIVELGKLIGRYLPDIPAQKLDSKNVSRDPAVVAAYDADPLIHHGLVPAGIARALIRGEETLPARLPELTLPVLILHGTADALADPAGARLIADNAGSEDVTLKLYDGLFHEVFNEPEKEQVLDDLVAWLRPRITH